ncbi:Pyridoxal 5'-phosphate synthase (glutamine hydrolyzing) [Bertholletia excelsa]
MLVRGFKRPRFNDFQKFYEGRPAFTVVFIPYKYFSNSNSSGALVEVVQCAQGRLVAVCVPGAMAVGVLALQGSFNEHIAVLRRLGVKSLEIRKPEQLQGVTSLIIPGGESTTMAKLAELHNLFPALREFVQMGKPVWGTCAGLIFLANKAIGQKTGGQKLVGGLDCTVHRNFFGSQIQSFEAELSVPDIAAKEGGPPTFRGVFIRAPAVLEVGPEVEILAEIPIPSNKAVL